MSAMSILFELTLEKKTKNFVCIIVARSCSEARMNRWYSFNIRGSWLPYPGQAWMKLLKATPFRKRVHLVPSLAIVFEFYISFLFLPLQKEAQGSSRNMMHIILFTLSCSYIGGMLKRINTLINVVYIQFLRPFVRFYSLKFLGLIAPTSLWL